MQNNNKELEFLDQIEVSNGLNKTIIKSFDNYMDSIYSSLGIKESDELKSEINKKFNDSNKYQIITNPNILARLKGLINFDLEINAIKKNNNSFFEGIEYEWNQMLTNLGKLQTFILLKQIKKNDCDQFIIKLEDALTNKINMVNTIIEENILSETDSIINQNNRNKYLKYKKKYLSLQQGLF